MGDYEEALTDLQAADRAMRNHENTLKYMPNLIYGVLITLAYMDVDKFKSLSCTALRHFLMLNWVITLVSFRILAKIKYLLNDYKGALVALNRADKVEPNNHVTLRYPILSSLHVLCSIFSFRVWIR